MMSVDPTCRYCQQRMEWRCTHIPTKISTGPYKNEDSYEYECKRCRSTQFFDPSGRPQHYLFWIGPYKLYFIPTGYGHPVFQLCNGNLGPIFELDYLPNLTPKNCNEERIKTLILFS